MHPVLFEIGTLKVYSYGFMIALGAIAGVMYMALRGKKEVGLTFDQANSLFLLIFIAAFVRGKVFLFCADASYYVWRPRKWLTRRRLVVYGSFLVVAPTIASVF